ncbi:MAG: hypothetical protein AB4426_00425 [Xenococcaceae cyanobacterium]
MLHKLSSSRILGGIIFLVCLVNPVAAHNVKTDADVGATFHIEPNHNPRAGEPAKAWFALTRQGGQLIPLEQCDCQLAVYAQSDAESDSPILNPPLKAISAEQYQSIPGADIVFPKAGIYELKISGSPKSGTDFQPFKLTYTVTVIPGIAAPVESPAVEKTESNQSTPVAIAPAETISSGQNYRLQWMIRAIAAGAILGIVSLWIVAQRGKSNR